MKSIKMKTYTTINLFALNDDNLPEKEERVSRYEEPLDPCRNAVGTHTRKKIPHPNPRHACSALVRVRGIKRNTGTHAYRKMDGRPLPNPGPQTSHPGAKPAKSQVKS